MKKQISYFSVAILSLGLFFASCKKKDTTDTDTSAQYKVESDDQARFTNENDAVANDVNVALEANGGSYGGRVANNNIGARPMIPIIPQLICDASVSADTLGAIKTITITYNGANCSGTRTRTGVVVLSFAGGFRWRNANSNLKVTYQNLKITRVSDGKSITINGEQTLTNVSGGRLSSLSAGVIITHTITSTGMSVTFDDGTQRTWQIAKKRVFSYDNGIVITTTGIAPAGGGIAEWGTNRYNNAFTNAIVTPLVIKQSCEFRLVSGQTSHVGPLVTTSTTFGLDAAGTAVASCPAGALYFKTIWTGPNGNTYTYIAPY